MDPVILSTERLLLRPVGPQDADAAYAACQDPDIQRWTTVPSPYLREHAEAFTGTFAPNGWRDDSEFTFAVLLKDASGTGEADEATGTGEAQGAPPEVRWWRWSASCGAARTSPSWGSGRPRSTGAAAI